MKKITLSLVSVMVLSGLSYAGGDIEPVVEEVPVVVEDNSAFYVGIGYGYFDQQNDNIAPTGDNVEFEANSILLQAGYQYNQYVALEGRYWIGVGDIDQSGYNAGTRSGDFDAWGLYVKPMYPVTNDFDIYALLGYADNTIDIDNSGSWETDGFSWGIGAQYDVMDNVLIFADYVSMASEDTVSVNGIDRDTDIDLYTINIGVSYKF